MTEPIDWFIWWLIGFVIATYSWVRSDDLTLWDLFIMCVVGILGPVTIVILINELREDGLLKNPTLFKSLKSKEKPEKNKRRA